MRCPECRSSKVQKSSAVYEQGVRDQVGSSSGAFITSRGTFGISKSRTTSRSSSISAQLNAPDTGVPIRSLVAGAACFAIGFFGLLVLESIVLFMLASAAAIPAAIYFLAPTEEELAEKRLYAAQWYCHTCGGIFHNSEDLHDRGPQSFGHHSLDKSIYRQTAHSRETYIQRVINPSQRTTRATERDLAGLNKIRSDAHDDGSFSPELHGYDLGLISRLASLSLITFDEKKKRLFVVGAQHTPSRGWWKRTFGR